MNKRSRFGLAIVLLVAPCLVHAQDVPPATPEVAPAVEPPLAPVAAPAPATPPTASDTPQVFEARQRVKRAEALFEAENYDAALAEFERAYELLAGHPLQPELLYNIALCHERRFRYSMAMNLYERYMREAGSTGEARADVEATVRTLGNLLGTVEIASNVKAEVWIDDKLVGSAPGTVLVPGGLHAIELRAAGHESAQRELKLAARETVKLDFELSAIGTGLSPVWFYSGVGATLASAIVGVGFAAKLKSEHDSFATSEPDSALNRPSDRDHLDDLALRADIFFAASGALAIGTAVLALFTDFKRGKPEADTASKPGVRISRTRFGIEGRF